MFVECIEGFLGITGVWFSWVVLVGCDRLVFGGFSVGEFDLCGLTVSFGGLGCEFGRFGDLVVVELVGLADFF